MLQRFCKSGILLVLGALIGAMLFDVVGSPRSDETALLGGSMGQDPTGAVVASYQREPFAVPHAGLDVIWSHFQR